MCIHLHQHRVDTADIDSVTWQCTYSTYPISSCTKPHHWQHMCHFHSENLVLKIWCITMCKDLQVTFMHYTVCTIKMMSTHWAGPHRELCDHHTNHWQNIIGTPSSHIVCYYNQCNCLITAHVLFQHVCTTPGVLLQHTVVSVCYFSTWLLTVW